MKTNTDFKKKIVELVFPITFQQFMIALVSTSDIIMLGKLNQNAMSAVSLATQVTFVFNLFMAAFIIGENMYVAQYFGKKDYAYISKTVNAVLRISMIVALIFLIGTICIPTQIMGLFTNEQLLVDLGSGYLRVVGISYFLSSISQVYSTIMKNCGAVYLSTWIGSIMIVLNIILNAIFIFGLFHVPALGIEGAALATVLTTGVGAVWSIIYVKRKMPDIKIHLLDKDRLLDKRIWEKMSPVLFNELVWGGGLTMYSVIMGHMGTDAVAANSIANISKNLVVCLCMGLGSAGSIIVGNELGAGRLEQAKEYGKTLAKASIICGILTGLVLLLISPFILQVVDVSEAARNYLKWMLIICSYYLIGKSINSMTIGGIFPAGGDSKFGLLCDTITLWCITVPLGLVCAFWLKLPVVVVYFVLNLDEIVKLPMVYRHYKKYKWVKSLT